MNPKLATVPRETFDSLANAYWILSYKHLFDMCTLTDRDFDMNQFNKLIDRDPFWIEACRVLEPGMLGGLPTSATVAESIERKANNER